MANELQERKNVCKNVLIFMIQVEGSNIYQDVLANMPSNKREKLANTTTHIWQLRLCTYV